MSEPIITGQLQLASSLREPTDAEIAAASARLSQLTQEAAAFGATPLAAPVHHLLGRIWSEQLGDARSAAVCFQNAFELDPKYRPNLESARRLFAAEGQWERALAVHEHEESQLIDPAARAESLRAQARILMRELNRPVDADARVQKALALAPEHPALLRLAIEAAERAQDKLGAARLLLRMAGAIKDDVQRGVLLRRAVLLFEELHARALTSEPDVVQAFAVPGTDTSPGVTELSRLHEESLRRLASASPGDPIAALVVAQRARATGAWDEFSHLAHEEAERTGAPWDQLLAAQIADYKQNHPQDALNELRAWLQLAPRDAAMRALELELVQRVAPAETSAALVASALAASGPSEKADLLVSAAAHATLPHERESLLGDALAENPGDAAAIALHVRAVAARDPQAGAERLSALADALSSQSPDEAADLFAEAALQSERAGAREAALGAAERALQLAPQHPAALRILARELPLVGGQLRLAALFEEMAAQAPQWKAAELLARAAALLSDLPSLGEVASEPIEGVTQIAEVSPMQRALDLAQRSAELSQGLVSPRGTEGWTLLALRAGDAMSLGRSLEARAAVAEAAERTELLLEAAELARLTNDELRARELLLRAHEGEQSAGRALLVLSSLPAAERIAALAQEALGAEPARAAALEAERAALLESAGRLDEAAEACLRALSAGGPELAVLRRLARVHSQRNDLPSALSALEELAQALEPGRERAAVFARAAGWAEWRLGDVARALALHARVLLEFPVAEGSGDLAIALPSLAARARLLHWSGRYEEAAAAYEELALSAPQRGQKTQSLRIAASLRAFRTHESGRAAALYRKLLSEEPGDLDAMAALLSLGEIDASVEGRRERAELRGKLASRCQDPRLAALLRVDSSEDRFAAGERDQGIAELRRALSLNPHDRIALDLVEQALRASGNRQLLADHLAFRCACEEGSTRAALAMEQAELHLESERFEQAAAAYRIALQSDVDSLLAVRGARRLAERSGEKSEVMRLFVKEAALAPGADAAARSLFAAAKIAEELGERSAAIGHVTLVLERDPRSADAVALLHDLLGSDAAPELIAIFERLGASADDASVGALAWAQAGRLHLDELSDAQSAFVCAGRALARTSKLSEESGREAIGVALLLRADAGERLGRFAEAADALSRAHALLPAADAGRASISLRLGLLCADQLGDRNRALPFLCMHPEGLRSLVRLAVRDGKSDAAFAAAAVLVGLGAANDEERTLHDAVAKLPPALELPSLADPSGVRASDDCGPARALLESVAAELALAFPTQLAGRAERVKGDNPVRRVCVALARALGLGEPALYLSKSEPALVAPVAAEAWGLLVGADAPRRFAPREQRFLYARALATVRNGTHVLMDLGGARLVQLCAEIMRISLPAADLSALPPRDEALARPLPAAFANLSPDAKAHIATLSLALLTALPIDGESLGLAMRESAERAAMILCGDPAVAIAIVAAECPGGLARRELARLALFAVSDAYLSLRAR